MTAKVIEQIKIVFVFCEEGLIKNNKFKES